MLGEENQTTTKNSRTEKKVDSLDKIQDEKKGGKLHPNRTFNVTPSANISAQTPASLFTASSLPIKTKPTFPNSTTYQNISSNDLKSQRPNDEAEQKYENYACDPNKQQEGGRNCKPRRAGSLEKRTPHYLDHRSLKEESERLLNRKEESSSNEEEEFDQEFEPEQVHEMLLKDEDALLDAALLLGRPEQSQNHSERYGRAWLETDCPEGCQCEFVNSKAVRKTRHT